MTTSRRAVLVGLAAALSGCATPRAESTAGSVEVTDTLYQVSTIDALSCGHFADEQTVGGLLERGGFGLGTVNELDGELAVVDGEAYAVRGDGTAVALEPETKTPFATVTAFEPDATIELENVESFEEFADRVTERLPRTDHFHALNLRGSFEFVRTRSVDGQVEPYPTLEDVLENETVFEFEDVEGEMPTFFIPDQFEQIHPPGYHAHFITSARDGGGHVYDFRADSLEVEIDHLDSVEIELAQRDVEEYPPC
ncbi:acetolactate decarboxylase [Natrarchaeobius sp. A-rgal3]|uniref:acetolactate decarboxylase n=1 Tax=Natrarchaeobius versutus TaxID=1679078 RepID=UPI00350F40E8